METAPLRWFALALLIGVSMPVLSAPKTDVIEMSNGDRITGEVRSLEHDQLKVSTYHMGTIYVEWDKVARVESAQEMQVEVTDGARYYGQLRAGDRVGLLLVDAGSDSGVERLETARVVRIVPIEGGQFIDRLDGYISAGFDFAKANGERNLDFAGGLTSRDRVREWSIDAAVNLTGTSSSATSEHDELQGVWKRFLRSHDFYLGMFKMSRNTELDLDLRTLLGGSFGRYFVQTNHFEWTGQLGLALSHENYAGGSAFNSVESLFATDFSLFRYDYPDTDVGGSLTLLPSLTQSGRYRAEAELHANYEFMRDLFLELSLYGSFDSKQPLTGDSASDYGVVTSVGYSF